MTPDSSHHLPSNIIKIRRELSNKHMFGHWIPMDLYLYATRNIMAGSEILLDYGKDFWENFKPHSSPSTASHTINAQTDYTEDSEQHPSEVKLIGWSDLGRAGRDPPLFNTDHNPQ